MTRVPSFPYDGQLVERSIQKGVFSARILRPIGTAFKRVFFHQDLRPIGTAFKKVFFSSGFCVLLARHFKGCFFRRDFASYWHGV